MPQEDIAGQYLQRLIEQELEESDDSDYEYDKMKDSEIDNF